MGKEDEEPEQAYRLEDDQDEEEEVMDVQELNIEEDNEDSNEDEAFVEQVRAVQQK